jgi:hypothetical protein
MNVSQSVVEALQANANLVSLVDNRIWNAVAPTGSTDARGPWIVFHRISNISEGAHDGDQQLARLRYQFTIGSSDKESVDAVRDALVNGLNCTEFTAASGQELSFFHADDHETFEPSDRTYTAIVDFFIWANT